MVGAMTLGAVMGIGGTVLMDVWAVVLNRVAGMPLPNWAMPGRWLGHVFKGRIFHDTIGDATPVPQERLLGWALHYGVGIAYGVTFVALVGAGWLAAPTFLPIWIFSLVTIAAGWFLLQPGMGLGWAASKTPSPWKTRALGLVAHSIFAVGMFGVALLAG